MRPSGRKPDQLCAAGFERNCIKHAAALHRWPGGEIIKLRQR